MYIDLTHLNNLIRWLMAIANIIIAIWSLFWFRSFWLDYRRRKINGPTKALILSFVARANLHGYLGLGFIYLASPYVTELRSAGFLAWGFIAILMILLSYTGLQWKFGTDES